MSCKCILCTECKGTGDVWYSPSGKYLGNHHIDDLAVLDLCPFCEGNGIAEMCDECLEDYEGFYEDWE